MCSRKWAVPELPSESSFDPYSIASDNWVVSPKGLGSISTLKPFGSTCLFHIKLLFIARQRLRDLKKLWFDLNE
jgi:hypothetical protein